jgi:uncharacterized lipoprotein YmbA
MTINDINNYLSSKRNLDSNVTEFNTIHARNSNNTILVYVSELERTYGNISETVISTEITVTDPSGNPYQKMLFNVDTEMTIMEYEARYNQVMSDLHNEVEQIINKWQKIANDLMR